MMEPVLDEIARQYDDKLIVGKMNVDDNLEMVRKFSVMSVPTLILFKEGQVLVQMVGAKNKAQLMQQLTPHL
jgi:thioredoxin 1